MKTYASPEPDRKKPWVKVITTLIFVLAALSISTLTLVINDWYLQKLDDDLVWQGGLIGLSTGNEESYSTLSADLKDIRDQFEEGTEGYEIFDELASLFQRLYIIGIVILAAESLGLGLFLAEIFVFAWVVKSGENLDCKKIVMMILAGFRVVIYLCLGLIIFLAPPVNSSCDSIEDSGEVCNGIGPIIYLASAAVGLISQGFVFWLVRDIREFEESSHHEQEKPHRSRV